VTRAQQSTIKDASESCSAVVLAPFGVANLDDAETVRGAIDVATGRVAFVVPAGRPCLPAEDIGFDVRTVALPRGVRGLLALVRSAFEIRRAVKMTRKTAVLWGDGPALTPYEAALKAGAWALGVRTLRRVHETALTAPEPVRFRPGGFFRIVASNAAAYRATRGIGRRAAGADLPAHCPTPVRRLIYVRTDLAFSYSEEPGGTMSHTEGVVGGLIDNRVAVMAISPRPVPVFRRPSPEWVRVTPYAPENVHPELVRAVADESVERELLSLALEPVDAIYTRYSLFNAAAMSLARERRVPLILEFNCSEAKFNPGGKRLIFERLGAEVEAELCRSASLVLVVSERVADEVRAMAPTARILVSPNAVDAAAFEVTDDVRISERQRLAVPDGDVLVGFVGRFYVWHGLDTLAEAATRFLNERPNSRLLLIGDGPYRESALRTLAPWGDRVIAPGITPHEQIPGLMAACDVLVAPHAPIEGFVGSPMKIFEYLASGRAIIASRLEQLADVITDGETGLLVTPGVVDELADAVIRLVDDPELRARLGHAGREEALAKHTWQARVRTILDAVEGVDHSAQLEG
jgi:glycosyltransferase involved in cell wall biosynthesis